MYFPQQCFAQLVPEDAADLLQVILAFQSGTRQSFQPEKEKFLLIIDVINPINPIYEGSGKSTLSSPHLS